MGATQGVAWAHTELGKPYSETKDGGVGPDYWDCSGLFQGMAKSQGVSIARTTSEQWATLQHIPAGQQLPGDGVYFEVPADGGPVPQHVGIVLGNGQMLEAPHTGDVVKITTIPNTPGERIWGYCRIPWTSSSPVTPPPAPLPLPNLVELLTNMNALDPVSGGTWVVDPTDGHVETIGSSPAGTPPYCGALNEPTGDRYNWKEIAQYIAGITPWNDPGGTGWGYAIIIRHKTPIPPSGALFSWYTFRRNGADK